MSALRLCASACALVLTAVLLPGSAAQAATNGPTIRVSVATDGRQATFMGSREPSISADGRYVVFSSADELAGDDTNPLDDVYLRDTRTGITELISVGPAGVEALGDSRSPAVSADGRFVVFAANWDVVGGQDDLGGTFLRDRQAGTTTRIGGRAFWGSADPDISPDGNFVAFEDFLDGAPEDTNFRDDVYVWERRTGTVSAVSVGADGRTTSGDSGSPTVSDDGRYVAYTTDSSVLTGGAAGLGFVVTDRATRRTTVVSAQPQLSGTPRISGDGRFVAFARNTGEWTTDIFSWDRATGRTVPVSVNVRGQPGTGISLTATISRTGRYIAFWSSARDLITEPVTAPMSVYRWDRSTGRSILAMTPPDDAFHGSERGEISDDGYHVATETKSATLVPGDTNGLFDVFRTEVSTPRRTGGPATGR